MFSGIFSTTIWTNAICIIGLLHAIYICSLNNNKLLRGTGNNFIPIIFVFLTTLYIGTRPITCYADTYLYTQMFNLVQSGEWSELPVQEPFFDFIEYICIDFTTASGWLLAIATFYVLGMSIATYRWLPKHFFIAVIFMFTAFSFWGYATNGIRNGMATSIALLGLSHFFRGKISLIIGYCILLVAVLTHTSVLLIIVAASVALFLKKTNQNLTIWLITIIIGLLFQEQFKSIFSGLIDDERLAHYLNQEVDKNLFSSTGFRWDFIIYSAMPILLGWYTIIRKGITDKTYQFLLHTYIFANAFWILINTAAYSNRFAYLSWFLYPILLAYPLCKFNIFKQQGLVSGLILVVQIVFTYIMEI